MKIAISIICGIISVSACAVQFAPVEYVNTKCSRTLTSANAYADSLRYGDVNTNDVIALINSSTGVVHTLAQWAKEPYKPTYTAHEVGARPNDWVPMLAQIGAQTNLVSGTNIKTINGLSILGSGDMSIGGSGKPDDYTTTNAVCDIVSSYGYVTKDITNGLESASHAAATYIQQEADPSVGITNGTVYIHGSHITPVVDPYYQEVTNAIYEYLSPAYEISSILLKEPIEWKLRPLSFVYPKGTVVYSTGTNNTAYWYAPIAIQGNIRPAAESSWVEIARPGWGLSSSSHAFDYLFDKIAAHAPGNYAAVSNAAMTAVQPAALDNYATWSWVNDPSSMFYGTSENANKASEADYATESSTAGAIAWNTSAPLIRCIYWDTTYERWITVDHNSRTDYLAYTSELPSTTNFIDKTVADSTSVYSTNILAVAERTTESIIAEADTTYTATNAVVSLNQSVQSVTIPEGGSLTIIAPTNAVKDWIVYAAAPADNTPLILPAGQYYATDEAYTNALKAGVTALYFTSCGAGTVISRQELKPITVE